MMKVKLFILLLMLPFLILNSASAQEIKLDFATELCTDYIIKTLQSGLKVSHSEQYIPITIEESENRIKTLYKDLRYKFVACGDEGLSDLNITIYDPEGIPVQTSTRNNNFPVLYFMPQITAPYLIKIEAFQSSGYFSFLIFLQ